MLFFNNFNKKYSEILHTLKNSNCHREIAFLEIKLFEIQSNRMSRNFKKNKDTPKFNTLEILLKNPTYLAYKKQWVIDQSLNIDFWDARLNYWEPLFKKFNSPLIEDAPKKPIFAY